MKLEYEGPRGVALAVIFILAALIALLFSCASKSNSLRPPLIIDPNPYPPIEDVIIEQPE